MSTIRASSLGAPTDNPQSVSNILGGVPKGWCYFNVSTGIKGSFGISSFTRNTTGSVNFGTSLTFNSINNMAIICSLHYGGVAWCSSPYTESTTTTSFAFQAANLSGSAVDANICHLVLCGTLA